MASRFLLCYHGKMLRLCGIRPTGRLHLGHYFSVIKPAVELGADVLVAEYHAPKATEDEVEEMYLALQEFGVASDYIHLQSKEFDPELYFRLLSIARVGELERMTQYMSSAGKHVDGMPAGNDAHLLGLPGLDGSRRDGLRGNSCRRGSGAAFELREGFDRALQSGF